LHAYRLADDGGVVVGPDRDGRQHTQADREWQRQIRNPRTEREYVRAGPVPGVTLGCGRVKTNGIIVLRASHQPVAVIAASVTILLR